ncbi:hypothetical protein IC582_029870 [Cucumis melo]
MPVVELKLSRTNRIYRPCEHLQGQIIVNSRSSISHSGIRLALNGSVNLQVRGGSAGVIESVYGVIKPILIVNRSILVRPSGKLASGTNEIPFSVILRQPSENLGKFYETFHGTDINIQVTVANLFTLLQTTRMPDGMVFTIIHFQLQKETRFLITRT